MIEILKKYYFYLRGLKGFFEAEEKTRNISKFVERSECKALFFFAKSLPTKGPTVEIGSFLGQSTIWIAKALEPKRERVYAVDPHTGDPYSKLLEDKRKELATNQEVEFRNNISKAGVQNTVVPIVKTSEEASKDFNEPVRFLFIDGIHEYDFVKTDFLCWSPKVVNGGVIAFHDSMTPGVDRLLKESLYKSKKYNYLGKVYYTAFFRKRRSNTLSDSLFNLRFNIVFPQHKTGKKPDVLLGLLLRILGVLIF